MNKSKKHTIYAVALVFSAMFVSYFAQAMDEPSGKEAPVYVVSSDGFLKRIERWKIDEMKELRVLLEQQRGTNSSANPLQVPMLRAFELDLLTDALDAISQGTFDVFYNRMVEGQGPALLSISESSLSILIEAAEKAKAGGISAFCLSRVVPSEVQKNVLVPYLIDPIIDSIPLRPLKVLSKHSDFVSDVIFSPDGRYIIACGLDEQPDRDVLMWDMTGEKFTFLKNAGCNIKAAWSLSGKYIVMSGADVQNNLCVLDMTTGQSWVLIGNPSIHGLSFSPTEERVVTGSFIKNNDNVIVWDVITGASVISMQHPGRVNAVAWSPDGKYIAAGGDGDENNLLVWDAETGKQYISIKHSGVINVIAWSPDSKYIVSGGRGQSNLIVWNAATGEQQISMQHPFGINAVAWSPDGRYIVLGRLIDLVVLNATTGEQLKIGKGHSDHISSVAFSPDGQYIASGCLGGENNLILWSLLSIKEKEALRNCTFAQAQLLYQLVLASVRGARVQLESPDVIQVFNSLSDEIKDLLKRYFGIALPIKCLPGRKGDCIIF